MVAGARAERRERWGLVGVAEVLADSPVREGRTAPGRPVGGQSRAAGAVPTQNALEQRNEKTGKPVESEDRENVRTVNATSDAVPQRTTVLAIEAAP